MPLDFPAATRSLVETMLRAQHIEFEQIQVVGNDVSVTLRRRDSFDDLNLPQTVNIDYSM